MENKKNILVVDDNKYNLLLTSKILRNYADEIFTAENSTEALDICMNKTDISLILMDVQMPGMNGFQTVTMIKQIEGMEEVPIIFVTGIYKSDEFVKQGFDLGAYDYLIKPFETKILQNKVHVFLTLFEQQKKLKYKTNELTKQKEYISKVFSSVKSLIIVLDNSGNVVISNCNPINIEFTSVGNFIEVIKNELDYDINNCFSNKLNISKEIVLKIDSSIKYYNCSISYFNVSFSESHVILTLSDITNQKNNEINYITVNRSLKILTETNKIIQESTHFKELFFGFCDILVSSGGYLGAWVSKLEKITDDEIFLEPVTYFSNTLNFQIQDINRRLNMDSKNPYVSTILNDSISFSSQNEIVSSLGLLNQNFQSEAIVSIPIKVENYFVGNFNIIGNSNLSINDIEKGLFNDISTSLNNALNSFKQKLLKEKAEEDLIIEKEELDISLSSIEDGVISVDTMGNIIFANKSAESILEYHDKKLVGERIYDIFELLNSKENTKLFNPIDWIQSTPERTKARKQIDIQTNKGEKKNISLGLSSINNPNGSFRGYIIVLTDLTEKIKLETQKALSQKMESVGQLAAGIAHEINTPLQYVGDNIYFLKDSFLNLSKIIQKLNSIFDTENKYISKQTLTALIEEYDLEFLLEETPIALDKAQKGLDKVGKIVLAMKNFAHPSPRIKSRANINQGIEVTATISKNVWKYVADLKLELDSNLPLVKCNLEEINQVVLNMIINSAHAIEEKYGRQNPEKGEIIINTSGDEEFIKIIITDNGSGIKNEYLNRIFDPFFTTKEVGKGTGQGLAIVHDIIVNKHKGRILVESTEGAGTIFNIILPINGE